jgi:hypothetical protein
MSTTDNCPYCQEWNPPADPRQCAAIMYCKASPAGYWYCTREKGHPGPHIACSPGTPQHNLTNVIIILTLKFEKRWNQKDIQSAVQHHR